MSKKQLKTRKQELKEKRYLVLVLNDMDGFENGADSADPLTKEQLLQELESVGENEIDPEDIRVYEVKPVEFELEIQREPTATARLIK